MLFNEPCPGGISTGLSIGSTVSICVFILFYFFAIALQQENVVFVKKIK